MINLLVKLLSLMVILLTFNAMRIHVISINKLAGLTVGDPVERTKQPLSV
jgi:vacuolar-type H+-ATPase catalytic subunit A/Vma1